MAKPRNLLNLLSRRVVLFLLAGVLFVLVLSAPTILCRSGWGIQLLAKNLTNQSLIFDANSIRVGWITPTTIKNVSIVGSSGSRVIIDELTSDMSLLDWLRLEQGKVLQLYARNTLLETQHDGGNFNIFDDLKSLQNRKSTSNEFSFELEAENVSLIVVDTSSQKQWKLNKSNARISYTANRCLVNLDGVLTDPLNRNGSLRCDVSYFPHADRLNEPSENNEAQWSATLELDSVPLSFTELIISSLVTAPQELPRIIDGDINGVLEVAQDPRKELKVEFDHLQIRKLNLTDSENRSWHQQLAELNGELALLPNIIRSGDLNIVTDFGHASIDGTIQNHHTYDSVIGSPSSLLDIFEGIVLFDIDIPSLHQSSPSLLPLRKGTKLRSGRINGRIESDQAGQEKESSLILSLNDLEAETETKQLVSLAPINVSASFEENGKWIRAKTFQWESEFGSASGEGDLKRGLAKFEISFERLADSLGPVLNIDREACSGSADGILSWNASADDSEWLLSGTVNAQEVIAQIGSSFSFQQNKINGELAATGNWGASGLETLKTLQLIVNCDEFELDCELETPTDLSNTSYRLPVRWTSEGQLAFFNRLVLPLTGNRIQHVDGSYRMNGQTEISENDLSFKQSFVEIDNFKARLSEGLIQQPKIQLELVGSYKWPNQNWTLNDFTLSSHCLSMRANGRKTNDLTEYEIRWRTLLDRLLTSYSQTSGINPATDSNRNTNRNFIASSLNEDHHWQIYGDGEGTLIGKHTTEFSQFEVDFQIEELSVPHLSTPISFEECSLTGANTLSSNARTIWEEPNTRMIAVVRKPADSNRLTIDQFDLSTEWIRTSLKGQLVPQGNSRQLLMEGTSKCDMDRLGLRIGPMMPLELKLTGKHESELKLFASLGQQAVEEFDLSTMIGWESGSLAGAVLPSAEIPIQANLKELKFLGSKIPLGNGWINLSGSIHQHQNETWIELNPGAIAEQLEISPAMSKQWLRYIAPLMADATEINGLVGLNLNEAKINLSDPAKTRLRGQLELDTIRLIAGPLTNQLIQSVQQINSIGKVFSGQPASREPSTILKMPKQSINFSVANQIVAHERLLLDVDRAQVITNGQVSFDGQMNLTAMVPLDARWLGSDLQRLAGQTLSLPIRGTLDRPLLDATNLSRVLADLGIQAIQKNAESYLEEQLNRGIEKLFGN